MNNTMVEPEIQNFVSQVDAWIKQFNREMQELKEQRLEELEMINNLIACSENNCKLFISFNKQITELEKEVRTLKTMQILFLKKQNTKKDGTGITKV